ncbi:MAG: poly-beta-hydroxybutyrate polymerase N-terminal domain-containing protein, partial [Sphingomonadaceae bacterium]
MHEDVLDRTMRAQLAGLTGGFSPMSLAEAWL